MSNLNNYEFFNSILRQSEKGQSLGHKIKARSEVAVEETWDLTTIFADDAAWEKEYEEIFGRISSLSEYQNKLQSSSEKLSEFLDRQAEISQRALKLAVYAHLSRDTDTTNSTYNGIFLKSIQLLTALEAAVSWAEPEIALISQDKMIVFLSENENIAKVRHYLVNIMRKKPHQLSAPEELLLAKAGEIFNLPDLAFSALNDADLKFPSIKDEEGKEIEITHGRYGKLLESRDRRVRKDAFQNLYKVYRQFENTNAALLAGGVNVHNLNAELRGFPSARAAALFKNAISEDVYDNLLTTVNENLPLLHRYVSLRKKVLGLDEIHSYDLYVSLIEGLDIHYTFAEAQEILLEALSPLGEEYVAILKKAFAERWIDRADNRGKRSGAYSSGSYGTNPYILMNWQGTLDNLFTLAHELGHSVHSWYSRNHQPYYYSDYSIFLAEIASTTNENLLVDYLLENSSGSKLKETVINHYLDAFKGTVFRQTQFAEFEHLIHTAEAAGTPLTSAFLSEEYGKINKKYYGPDLVADPEIALEWSRIPHFYLNYYVYQYATGFSAASSFSRMIQEEGQPAVDRYLDFLRAGSSDYPLAVLKKAGVDMSEVKPIEDAFHIFAKYLQIMAELLD